MVIARRSRAAVVLSLLVSGVVLSSSAVSAGSRSADRRYRRAERTSRPRHRARSWIREASGRYAERGHKAGELRAVKDATGIVIAPVDTKFDTYTATLEDGSQVSALAPLTAEDPAWVQDEAAAGEAAALAAPTWSFVKNHCFSQISDTWSVLDH